MSDTTGSANTEPDPATADNPPSDIKAGDQARDPEGSAAHRSDQRDAGISDDDVPAGDQGGWSPLSGRVPPKLGGALCAAAPRRRATQLP